MLCALEAAAESELEAGETSQNNKKVAEKVTDDDEVGETNRQRKVGITNKGVKVGKTKPYCILTGKKRRREDS